MEAASLFLFLYATCIEEHTQWLAMYVYTLHYDVHMVIKSVCDAFLRMCLHCQVVAWMHYSFLRIWSLLKGSVHEIIVMAPSFLLIKTFWEG